MDYAEKQTDIEVLKVEKHLEKVYKQAADELQKEANEYFSKFAERYEKEHDAFLQGKYTAQEFKNWYYTQVGRGEKWQVLKTDAAQKMVSVNQMATAYINDKTPGIYALNANFTAYEIEKGSGIAFNLVNEDVVRELALDKNHSEFRVLSVNPKRDYEWNQSRIQNELLSGILQGKSIDKLADGFMNVMGNNRSAAVRNARTALTSAQNAGRQNTFNKAEELGIEMEKEWIATADNRTRDSHRMLDGVVVKNSQAFPNKLMYPGDPDGEPEEVYNCRCSMRAIMPKYPTAKRTDNTAESYKKWLEEKKEEQKKRTGLAAGRSEFVKPHKEYEFLGSIDFNDKKVVDSILSQFEDKNIMSDIEVACVITSEGDIYKCYGQEKGVWPNYDLGDKIIGSYISHIHPQNVTNYSFSGDDFELFNKYKLVELRGADYKYRYILDRTGIVQEPASLEDLINGNTDYYHEQAIVDAIAYGYGYRRTHK